MLPPDNHEELFFDDEDVLKVPLFYPGSENEDLSPDDSEDDDIPLEEDLPEDLSPYDL